MVKGSDENEKEAVKDATWSKEMVITIESYCFITHYICQQATTSAKLSDDSTKIGCEGAQLCTFSHDAYTYTITRIKFKYLDNDESG
mgnify:CR=1 FL=1